MIKFNHFNFNVLDLNKSLAFYKEALGLEPVREKDASDGSFKLPGLDSIHRCEIEIQHHFLSPYLVNFGADYLKICFNYTTCHINSVY